MVYHNPIEKYQNGSMFREIFPALIAAGASLLGAAITSSMSRSSQKNINQQNIDFQKAENDITRQREDTAHQREVEDLKASGLSPLASLGGAQASPLSAPQADVTGYLQSASQMQAGIDGLNSALGQIYSEKSSDKRQEKQLHWDQEKQKIDNENAIAFLDKEQKFAESQDDLRRAHELEMLKRQLESSERIVGLQNNVKYKDMAIQMQAEQKSVYVSELGQNFDDYYYCNTEEEFQKRLSSWQDFITKFNLDYGSRTGDVSTEIGGKADVQFNKSKSIAKAITGVEGELSVEGSKQTSKSISKEYQNALLDEMRKQNIRPPLRSIELIRSMK